MYGVVKIVSALLYIVLYSIVDTNIKYLTDHYVCNDNEYRILYFTISRPISLLISYIVDIQLSILIVKATLDNFELFDGGKLGRNSMNTT